jgi:hypothetical protein
MTDPDLVFDMDPKNVLSVERWIAGRWPDASLAKQADGSRLTWALQGADARCVVATESFLCLPADDVSRHLESARSVCDERSAGEPYELLLSTDGVQAL